jgi:transcriptional regulator with XRE-family HTH domain
MMSIRPIRHEPRHNFVVGPHRKAFVRFAYAVEEAAIVATATSDGRQGAIICRRKHCSRGEESSAKGVFHFSNLTEISFDRKHFVCFFVLVLMAALSDIPVMSDIVQNKIRERLEKLGKSAAGASIEAGLGRSAITDILAGNSGSPRLVTLEKIAHVLDCSVAYLIGSSLEPGVWSPLASAADDVQLLPIYADLEIGVFRSVQRHAGRFKDPALVRNEETFPAFGDDRYPDWPPTLYRAADNSMDDIGIHAGDILTALHGYGEEHVLTQGLLVVVRRTIETQHLEERSLRIVDLRPDVGQIGLVARSRTDDYEPIVINTERAAAFHQKFLNNVYPETDGSVWIDGVVVRATRRL